MGVLLWKRLVRKTRSCKDSRWMELAQDHVQWLAFLFAMLNLGVLLPQWWMLEVLVTRTVAYFQK